MKFKGIHWLLCLPKGINEKKNKQMMEWKIVTRYQKEEQYKRERSETKARSTQTGRKYASNSLEAKGVLQIATIYSGFEV